MTAHVTSNTDKVYPCVMCGSESANIIREGADPRLKCNNSRCNFMYNASDSTAAQEQGTIPDGLPELQAAPDPAANPRTVVDKEVVSQDHPTKGPTEYASEAAKLPRTITHLIIAKDRYGYDFCNKKNLNAKLLSWSAAGKTFDLYELTPKKVSAKIDIT